MHLLQDSVDINMPFYTFESNNTHRRFDTHEAIPKYIKQKAEAVQCAASASPLRNASNALTSVTYCNASSKGVR